MLIGLQLEKYVTGHGMSNQRSESRALLTQQTWIALGILGEQIDWGIAVQSSSEKLLTRQLYTCEHLRRDSNTADTIFC